MTSKVIIRVMKYNIGSLIEVTGSKGSTEAMHSPQSVKAIATHIYI